MSTRLIRCTRHTDGFWAAHYMDCDNAPCIIAGRNTPPPEWFTNIWNVALIGGRLKEKDFSSVWCHVTPEFELVRFHSLLIPKEQT